jgi:hypothetical protein
MDGKDVIEAISTAMLATSRDESDEMKSTGNLREYAALSTMKHKMIQTFKTSTIGWSQSPTSEIASSSDSSVQALPQFVESATIFNKATHNKYEKTDRPASNPCTFSMPEYVVGIGPNEFILSDYNSALVRRYLNGQVETIAGIQGAGNKGGDFMAKARFSMPRGGCVAPNGDMYLADFGNNRICIFDARTNEVRSIGTGKCSCVDGVAGPGDIGEKSRLPEFESTSRPSFASPYQLILRRDQRAFFLAEWTHIRWISYPDHEVRTYAGSEQRGHQDGPRLTAKFCGIVSLLETPDGRYLLVSEYSNNCVRIIDAKTGIVSTLLGGKGPEQDISGSDPSSRGPTLAGFLDGPLAQSLIESPMCMAWNPHGDLLLADSVNHSLRIVHGLCEALHNTHSVPLYPMSSYLFEHANESIFGYFPSLLPFNQSGKTQNSRTPSFDLQRLYLLDQTPKTPTQHDVHSVSLFQDLPGHADLCKGLNNFVATSSNSLPLSDKSSSSNSSSNGIWPANYSHCAIENPFNASEWIHPSFAFLLSLHNIHALSSIQVPSQYCMKRFSPIGGALNLASENNQTVADLFNLITGHARIIFQMAILSAHATFQPTDATIASQERINFFPTTSGPPHLFVELWSSNKLGHMFSHLQQRIGALLILIWRLQLNVEFSAQLGREWFVLRNKTFPRDVEVDFAWMWDLTREAKRELGKHFAVRSTTDPSPAPNEAHDSGATLNPALEEPQLSKSDGGSKEPESEFVPWSLYMDHFRIQHRQMASEDQLTNILVSSPEHHLSEDGIVVEGVDSENLPADEVSIEDIKFNISANLRLRSFRDDIDHNPSDFLQPEIHSTPITFYTHEPYERRRHPAEIAVNDANDKLLMELPRPLSDSEPHRKPMMIGTRRRRQDIKAKKVRKDPISTASHLDSNFDLDLHLIDSPTPLSTLFRYLFYNRVFVITNPQTLDPFQGNKGSENAAALAPNLLITCDDVHYIHCHDWVLTMRWQWTASVLSSGLAEANTRVISLSSSTTMTTESLLLLIQFLYTHSLGSDSNSTVEHTLKEATAVQTGRASVADFLRQLSSMRPKVEESSLDPIKNPKMALLRDIRENGELLGMISIHPTPDSAKNNVPALMDVIPSSHTFASLLRTLRRPFDKTPKTLADAFSLITPFSRFASKSQYHWLISYLITNLSLFSSHPQLLDTQFRARRRRKSSPCYL